MDVFERIKSKIIDTRFTIKEVAIEIGMSDTGLGQALKKGTLTIKTLVEHCFFGL